MSISRRALLKNAAGAALAAWIAMSSAAAPLSSATPEFPYGQYDKELRDRIINFKGLRGIRTWDVTDPTKPNLLQEFSAGEKAWALT